MIFLKTLLNKNVHSSGTKTIQKALSLHRRGEVRRDGLTLYRASHRLEIEWCARNIHPWDGNAELAERERMFTGQCLADSEAALSRLSEQLPAVDVIEFRVIHPDSRQRILAGTAERSEPAPTAKNLSPRTRLWHRGITAANLAIAAFVLAPGVCHAGSQTTGTAPVAASSGTSTDLFVMFGSDFDRPGLVPRANYNIGVGHTFGFLKNDLIGDELTFAYTYENAGSHGFLHTPYGEHTESAGVMKNFSLPKTKTTTGYTWLQSGITSYTGFGRVKNRLDSGVSLGAIVHFNMQSSIWIQESYSKVVTVPWYTTSSIGYTCSW